MTAPITLSKSGEHVTVPAGPPFLELVANIDLMLDMRRQVARHHLALLGALVLSIGSLSAWNVARGSRISAVEASLSELRLTTARELADVRRTCQP